MKKIIALALSALMLLSLTACGGADDSSATHQEKKEVKNPVRSELYDENGKILADITYEYDADGRRISNTTSWNYGWSEGSETDTYTYNDNGDVLTKTATYSYSEYGSVTDYHYDDEGKLIKVTYGDDSYGTKYVYGDDGRISESYSFNGDEENLWQTYTYTDDSMIQTEVWDDWTFTYTTYYDEDGNILKWEYKSNDQVMITHNYTYDSEGNLTKQDVSIESWKMEGYVVHYYE